MRRVRLHHLAHRLAQDSGWRTGAVARCRRRRAGRHRFSARRGRHGRVRHEQRFRRRGLRTCLDDQACAADRTTGLVFADGPLRGSTALAPAAQRHPRRARARSFTAQIAGRPIGVMMGIGTALNPFTVRPSYKKIESLPIAEQRKRLRDPQIRAQILAEAPSDSDVAKLAQFRQAVTRKWDRFYVMGDPPDYEPPPEKSVAVIAAREGRPPDEVAYDYITGGEGR